MLCDRINARTMKAILCKEWECKPRYVSDLIKECNDEARAAGAPHRLDRRADSVRFYQNLQRLALKRDKGSGRIAVTAKPKQADLDRLDFPDYAAYLNSPHWKKTAKAARKRAGNRCQVCTDDSQSPSVHHNTYERLGAELDADLVCLCPLCHRDAHSRTKVEGKSEQSQGKPDLSNAISAQREIDKLEGNAAPERSEIDLGEATRQAVLGKHVVEITDDALDEACDVSEGPCD